MCPVCYVTYVPGLDLHGHDPLWSWPGWNDYHTWVVHGYDATTPYWLFLMNMGSGGDGDGWYTLDDCGYPDGQTNLIRVAPENVHFVGASTSGDGSPGNPHENVEEALAAAPDYGTLIFKAATTHTFAAPSLVIDRPLTLKGNKAVIDRAK